VDFSGVDFREIRQTKSIDTISFSGFNFPIGKAYFRYTIFGTGDVIFNRTNFGEGNVDFSYSNFGEGNVDFSEANFGKGSVEFIDTTFGKGFVNFDFTIFGGKYVDFSGATFEDDVNFAHVTFEGDVEFSYTTFDKGTVFFGGVITSSTIFRMEGVKSKAILDLSGLHKINHLTTLSFRHASLEDSLILPSGRYNCVPDLRNTKISKAITFHDIIPTLKRTKKNWWEFLKVKTAIDEEDASRFRRLKELAEINRDHQAALTYHASELRALRWTKSSIPASILDAAFSWASDYGQSVWRPIRAFLLMDLFFFGFYASSSGGNWIDALKTVIANSLPFLTYSRAVQTESLFALYGDQIPIIVNSLTFVQGIGSVIFLFLIGLGLRNRFRI